MRFAEDAVAEIQRCHCSPAHLCIGFWVWKCGKFFKRAMTKHIESVKRNLDLLVISVDLHRQQMHPFKFLNSLILNQYIVFFNLF